MSLLHSTAFNTQSRVRRLAAAVFATGVASVALAAPAAPLNDVVLTQIQSLMDEKASRTPAQRKMDSQLIYAAKAKKGVPIAAGITSLQVDVKPQADGRVLVDIVADVTPALLARIGQAGGTVVSSHPKFRAIRASLPVEAIEGVADAPGVQFIRRAAEARTHVGSVNSEGDVAHLASQARSTFGPSGAGVKVGVLSDSVDYLATSQSTGDLGPVTVLADYPGSGEGTAMLEIIHDLAPNAALYFATAFISEADFAQNILDLRTAGCGIIVDDVVYFDEPVFQDGIVAQAVNTVTADGALYFSSASNSGNKTDGTSGTWEGDFADGGPATSPINVKGGRLHDFGGGITYSAVSGGSDYRVDLFWADPWGASTNDYDVFVLNSSGSSVLGSSTTTQNGSQNPYETIGTLSVNNRIVIVKGASAAPRFLHLETGRGQLTLSTAGNTRGHSAASNAFSVAAVSAAGRINAFTSANPVESFSSDGLRRIFYYADGTPVTPGDFSSSGGLVRQKPDLAAADGVQTSVTGFKPFYGTSAAAPHAAAIAALLLSCSPTLTPAQIRTALTNTALDNMSASVDRDSGAGIIMAFAALHAMPLPLPVLAFAQMSDVAGGNGNGYADPGETIAESVTWTNICGGAASNMTAALFTGAPGVTLLQTSSVYATIAPYTSGTNSSLFTYRLAKNLTGGTPLVFTNILSGNGRSFTGTFTRIVGQFVASPSTTNVFVSSNVPKAIPDLATIYCTNTVVAGTAYLDDVNVGVRLNHTYDSDLVITVLHPDGTAVALANNRGASGDNFGTGYPPGPTTNTVFDDQAGTAIRSSSAPFAGSYRPDGVLSNLNGKMVAGAWVLRIQDTSAIDTGTVYTFSLTLVSHSNSYPVALFNTPPVASNQSVLAVAGVLTNLLLRGADADGDALTFRTNSAPAHGTLTGFNTNSGAIAYTAAPGYAGTDSFTFVVNDGFASSLSATVTLAVAGANLQTVTVVSAWGGAWPGTLATGVASTVSEWITNSPVAGGVGTQYVCIGATVASNDYTLVSATNITLILTNPATLTWNWRTQVWLSVAASGAGSVAPASAWQWTGSNVVLTAMPSNYWAFGAWSGDTGNCTFAANALTAGMTRTRSVAASFLALLATNQTPQWWLAQYGLTNGGADFNTAALADTDGDGYFAWQEYVAGTVPTNASSIFLAGLGMSNALPYVTWTPDLGTARVYTVSGRTNLEDAATWGATNADSRFFRVNVSLP